jgi:hypothetical protein
MVITVLLLPALFALSAGGQAVSRSSAADASIKRLAPAAFTKLPRQIRRNLEARRCTILQNPAKGASHNVISGEFIRKGQEDWAVLCSTGGMSSILIFRQGYAGGAPLQIAKVRDFDLRSIARVGRDYIMKHYRYYGGPKPPPIDHHGIDDGGDMVSVVRYYYRGRWRELQGAD